MGQQDVGDFLEKHKGQYFTVQMIVKGLKGANSESSVKHSLRSLLKRSGYNCKIMTGYSMRSAALVSYSYNELEEGERNE